MIEGIEKLSFKEFSVRFKELSEEDINELLDTNFIYSFKEDIFNAFFLRINSNQKQRIINNKEGYKRLINSQKQNNKLFRILNTSSFDVFKYLVEHDNANEHYKVFIQYFETFDIDKFQETLTKINIKKLYSLEYDLSAHVISDYIVNKFPRIKLCTLKRLLEGITDNKINELLVYKVTNLTELHVLSYFNVVIQTDGDYDDVILKNGEVFPKTVIKTMKTYHFKRLFDALNNKYDYNATVFFDIAVKLYVIFGFSNALSIINDKFSYLNKSANEKIINVTYKDEKREYRFNNQDKFYYHNLEYSLLYSLHSNDNTLLKRLTKIEDQRLLNEIKLKMLDLPEEELKNYVIQLINQREKRQRDKLAVKMSVSLDNKCEEMRINGGISLKDLANLVSEIDLLRVYNLSDAEKKSFYNMMIENGKKDNNCLLRLLINKESLGLEFNYILNNFKSILKKADKSNISLFDILSLIEMLKIDLYHVPYSCKDIYLRTLVDVNKSKKYIVNSNVNIIDETLKLHIERKFKTASSIPSVHYSCDDYKYYTPSFDSEYLLSLGVSTDSCMKIGAPGEDFFKYILLNDNSSVVIIELSHDEKYYLPMVRSGNAVHINAIEPSVPSERIPLLIGIINQIFTEYTSISDKEEKIEVITLTDMHIEGELKFLEKYNLEEYIPLIETTEGKYIYTDYNKKAIDNYVVASNDYTKNKYYVPNVLYSQNRVSIFEYNSAKEYDTKRLELLLNVISYTQIDLSNASEASKEYKKVMYEPIKASNFAYIIGNKDWYIGVDEDYKLVGEVLPFDQRAIEEYSNNVKKTLEIANDLKDKSNNARTKKIIK